MTWHFERKEPRGALLRPRLHPTPLFLLRLGHRRFRPSLALLRKLPLLRHVRPSRPPYSRLAAQGRERCRPAREVLNADVAHAECSVCCLRRIVSGRRFLFGLLVGLCPFCRLLIGVLCSLARNFIPVTSFIMRNAIPLLFRFLLRVIARSSCSGICFLSTGFPHGSKGCSMGAERVIKGCSARDHPNVIPICKQRRHLCRRSPFFYFKLI